MNFIITYSCCEREDGGAPIFRYVIFTARDEWEAREKAKNEVIIVKANLGIDKRPDSLQAKSFSAHLYRITPIQANIDKIL